MAGKIRTKNSEQPNQKQALNRAGGCTYPDEDRPLSLPHLRLSAQALLPDENQSQAGSPHRRLEPSAGPTLAALLDLGLLFTASSTLRCRSAVDRFPGVGRNASQIKNKRLNLNRTTCPFPNLPEKRSGHLHFRSRREERAFEITSAVC